MRCSICKKENAIIHIREYAGDKTKKINLCLDCALKRGFNASVDNVDNILSNIVQNIFEIPKNRKKSKNSSKTEMINIVCPSCGTSVQEFTSNMYVGCSLCYSVFEKIIELVVYNHNNSFNYLGKLPDDLKSVNLQKVRLKKLKKELRIQINSENYIKAASLRDEINKIKINIQKRIRKIAN